LKFHFKRLFSEMAAIIASGWYRPMTCLRLVPRVNYSTEKRKSWKFWGEEKIAETSEVEKEAESRKNYLLEIEKDAKEEYIQARRNKSRLTASHRQVINGQPPYEGRLFEYEDSHRGRDFKRKLLAKYGVKSGVDPGISWPTDEELELAQEWEKVYQPDPLPDMITKAWDEARAEKEGRMAREKEITENLEKMEKQLLQWNERVRTRNQAAQAETLRRERILSELKAELGYDVNPEDRHMVERIAEKEKAMLKEEKEAKKARKKKIMEERAAQKASQGD